MKSILSVLAGHKPARQPIWLMRQAGRYLPEYRELRARAGSFMKLALNPELAAEVTLQPVRRFGMDGAILFSDILIVPYALGQRLDFVEGEGPKLEPLGKTLPRFDEAAFFERSQNIFATVRRTAAALPPDCTMLGFAGSPWTVACYLLGGTSKDEFTSARARASEDPAFFRQLLDVLAEATVFYLSQQIKAGAEAVQLFDSWSGLVPKELFADWVITPTAAIVAGVKKLHPDVPIIGFPRGAGDAMKDYALRTGVTALSIDEHTDIAWAEKNIAQPLQGNLAPDLMSGPAAPMLEAAEKICASMTRPFIFNLGHGLTPKVPPENVKALVDKVHSS